MSIKGKRFSIKSFRGLAPLGVTLIVLAMVGGPAMMAGAAPQDRTPQTPLVQQFEDVPDSHTFAEFINNLYLDAIISGYPCGGAGEPCGPGNLPYYRPNANVTRAQMSKFVDNGRRNIADAIGDSLSLTSTVRTTLTLSDTVDDGLYARTSSNQEAVQGQCTRAGVPCYAIYGLAEEGNRAAIFVGGRGVYAQSDQANYYSLDVQGGQYRGAYILSNNNSYYSLYVDQPATGNFAGFNTSVNIFGNLSVSGSKGGYVVDLMQNAGDAALVAGDVVTIVGSGEAVLGEIPVVHVQRAVTSNDTGVVGVVDQIMYVPSKEVREAYAQQEQARREAMQRVNALEMAGAESGVKPDPSLLEIPAATISDREGNVSVDEAAKVAETGRYVNVVTLGSYKAVKVDASFGAIRAGDLLTTSPNPGYAMKVTDKAEATGAIIGKALGDLASGTGTVPVMVTLK